MRRLLAAAAVGAASIRARGGKRVFDARPGDLVSPDAFVREADLEFTRAALTERVGPPPYGDGRGAVVYVLDSGCDEGVLETWASGAAIEAGPTFAPGEDADDARDGTGHGTNVASVLLALAPRARLVCVRVFNREGWGSVSRLLDAVEWVAQRDPGAIINFSGVMGAVPAAEAVLNATNATLVFAAGNGGAEACRSQPALLLPNVVGVGALTGSGAPARFSNFGACARFWAWGEGVPAAAGPFYGTSAAAPQVAALMAQARLFGVALTPPLRRPALPISSVADKTCVEFVAGGPTTAWTAGATAFLGEPRARGGVRIEDAAGRELDSGDVGATGLWRRWRVAVDGGHLVVADAERRVVLAQARVPDNATIATVNVYDARECEPDEDFRVEGDCTGQPAPCPADCTFFGGHGCRAAGFCGFRIRARCPRRCVWRVGLGCGPPRFG